MTPEQIEDMRRTLARDEAARTSASRKTRVKEETHADHSALKKSAGGDARRKSSMHERISEATRVRAHARTKIVDKKERQQAAEEEAKLQRAEALKVENARKLQKKLQEEQTRRQRQHEDDRRRQIQMDEQRRRDQQRMLQQQEQRRQEQQRMMQMQEQRRREEQQRMMQQQRRRG